MSLALARSMRTSLTCRLASFHFLIGYPHLRCMADPRMNGFGAAACSNGVQRLAGWGGVLLNQPLTVSSNGMLESSAKVFKEDRQIVAGDLILLQKKNYPRWQPSAGGKECNGPSLARQRGNRWSIATFTDPRQRQLKVQEWHAQKKPARINQAGFGVVERSSVSRRAGTKACPSFCVAIILLWT